MHEKDVKIVICYTVPHNSERLFCFVTRQTMYIFMWDILVALINMCISLLISRGFIKRQIA